MHQHPLFLQSFSTCLYACTYRISNPRRASRDSTIFLREQSIVVVVVVVGGGGGYTICSKMSVQVQSLMYTQNKKYWFDYFSTLSFSRCLVQTNPQHQQSVSVFVYSVFPFFSFLFFFEVLREYRAQAFAALPVLERPRSVPVTSSLDLAEHFLAACGVFHC